MASQCAHYFPPVTILRTPVHLIPTNALSYPHVFMISLHSYQRNHQYTEYPLRLWQYSSTHSCKSAIKRTTYFSFQVLALQNSLNGICSFNGQKDIYKKLLRRTTLFLTDFRVDSNTFLSVYTQYGES